MTFFQGDIDVDGDVDLYLRMKSSSHLRGSHLTGDLKMITIPRRASLVQSALLALVALAARSTGAVIYVNVNNQGPQDGTSWQTAFKDLQSALSIAQPGNQIWVAH